MNKNHCLTFDFERVNKSQDDSRFHLSSREKEIVELLLKGFSSEEIARQLFLSKNTVNTHRRNIHEKTGAKNTVELMNLLKG